MRNLIIPYGGNCFCWRASLSLISLCSLRLTGRYRGSNYPYSLCPRASLRMEVIYGLVSQTYIPMVCWWALTSQQHARALPSCSVAWVRGGCLFCRLKFPLFFPNQDSPVPCFQQRRDMCDYITCRIKADYAYILSSVDPGACLAF